MQTVVERFRTKKGRLNMSKYQDTKTVIKRYRAESGGEVTITEYINEYALPNGKVEYCVEHSNKLISAAWFLDRYEAILHAQFLAGKY